MSCCRRTTRRARSGHTWTRSTWTTFSPRPLPGTTRRLAGLPDQHNAYRWHSRFEELIGITPKRLARTHRFAATVFAINPAEPIDWADLAGGAGYFDQAHFGHGF